MCSTRIGAILLSALLVLSLLGTVFPQITADIQADQAAQDQWWAAACARYGALTGVLRTLGAFSILSSPLFLLLVAALLANGTACTLSRFAPIWRTLKTRSTALRPDSLFAKAAHQASLPVDSGEEGRHRATAVLSKHRYRVATEEHEEATYIVGDKNRFARVGTLITHGALVFLVLGALLGGRLAWREPAVVLGPGQVYTVGHGTDFAVRNEGFETDRYEDGTVRNYFSQLVVLEDGAETTRKRISVNDPLAYEGVGIYLSSAGPALRLEGWDDQDQPLNMQTEVGDRASSAGLVLNFSAAHEECTVYLPSMELWLDLSLLEKTTDSQSSDQPFVAVEVYDADRTEPLTSARIASGETLQLPSGTLRFVADTYSVLQIASDPGFLPVVLSGLVGTAGLLISFFFCPSRVWVKVTASELVVAGSAARNRLAFSAQFARLVRELEGRP